jgi:hypothetical protein
MEEQPTMVEILNRLNEIQAENEQLRQENAAIRTQRTSPPRNMPDLAYRPATAPSRRAVMPDPERFDGSNPRLYDSFQRDLRAKFRIDGWQYPSAQDKADYIMIRLSGTAKLRAGAWMTSLEKTGQIITNHESLLTSLSRAYHDTESEKRALDKLSTYRQGNLPIGTFLANFDVLLTEAGGSAWDPAIKINFLKRTLKKEILQGMVGALEPEDYDEYCNFIRRMDNQLWNVKRVTTATEAPWKSRQPVSTAATDPDVMDWQRTIASFTPEQIQAIAAFQSGFPQAQQKTSAGRKPRLSQEEREQRRRDGLCFRCNKPWTYGHRCVHSTTANQRKPSRITAITNEDDSDALKEEPLD